MKRLLIAALGCLTACHEQPEAAAIDRNAAMIQESLEQQAANMEAMANNATDPIAGEALENAADLLDEARDNIAEAADAAKDDVEKR